MREWPTSCASLVVALASAALPFVTAISRQRKNCGRARGLHRIFDKTPALRAGLATLLALACAPVFASQLQFEWRDDFGLEERQRLAQWVTATRNGVEQLVGPFPLNIRIEMLRQPRAREPVPWAETLRRPPQGIRFHVDPTFDDTAFLDDWTAAHELSHLILPYLGTSAAWFSEGFASYMQYRVLAKMGRLSSAQAQSLLRQRITSARADNPFPTIPFAQAAPRLHRMGRYPVMYWGGAAYFARVDAALHEDKQSLDNVLRQYLECCRSNFATIDEIAETLDGVAGTDIFARELNHMRAAPGIPKLPPRIH